MTGRRTNPLSLREFERYYHQHVLTKALDDSATSQWFANLDFIKEDALNALKDVSFFPEACKQNKSVHLTLSLI
jgi:isoleucyl-tRNA synthetase